MKSKYIFFLLLVAVISACKDKKAAPDCGCDGPTTSTIGNAKASYLGSNGIVIRIKGTDDKVYDQRYDLCAQPDTLAITPDSKNPDYIISGKVKNRCFTGQTLVALPPLIEITEIRKAL